MCKDFSEKYLSHQSGFDPILNRIGTFLLIWLLVIVGVPANANDIAFFFALDADWKAFKKASTSAGDPVKVGNHNVQRLEVGTHHVYAVKMGSGAVESAVSATALLTRFHCDLAFSVGPVGAIDDRLELKSWYEVEEVIDYQKGSWQKLGFQAVTSTQKAIVPSKNGKKTDNATRPQFSLPMLPATARKMEKVTVASGEIFVASTTYREQLHAQTLAQAVDMNLFGLSSACIAANVPLWSWRIVSDRADDDANEVFRAFVASYDGSGGRAVAEMIHQLPADPNAPETYPALKRLLEKTSTTTQSQESGVQLRDDTSP